MDPSPNGPEYLVIVDRTRADLYEYLVRRFADDTRANVVLDRRRVEQSPEGPGRRPRVERRQASDVQETLRRNGLAMVRVKPTRPVSVFARAAPWTNAAEPDRGRRAPAPVPDVGALGWTTPDAVTLDELRARLTGWVEHGQELMRRLADRSDSTRETLTVLAEECRALRAELAEVKVDNERLRARWNVVADALARHVDELGRSLDNLKGAVRQGTDPRDARGSTERGEPRAP